MRAASARRKARMALAIALAVGCACGATAYAKVRARQATEQRLRQAAADFQRLADAIGAYGVDRCGIFVPPDTSWRRLHERDAPLTLEWYPGFPRFASALPESRRPSRINDPLTTPVAYLDSIPLDPFGPNEAPAAYGYIGFGLRGFALIRSLGPDGDADLDLRAARSWAAEHVSRLNLSTGEATRDLTMSQIGGEFYDPTNGVSSDGDLVAIVVESRPVYGFGLNGFPENSEWLIERPTLPPPQEVTPIPSGIDIEVSRELAAILAILVRPSPEDPIEAIFLQGADSLGSNYEASLADRDMRRSTLSRNSEWWSLVRTAINTRPADAPQPWKDEFLFGVLPIMGKSWLLVAVEDGDLEAIDAFATQIAAIGAATAAPTPEQRRVLDELARLSAVARKALARDQSSGGLR